jgi:heme/copper-type cytochrome/quinol oxidase subunit 2
MEFILPWLFLIGIFLAVFYIVYSLIKDFKKVDNESNSKYGGRIIASLITIITIVLTIIGYYNFINYYHPSDNYFLSIAINSYISNYSFLNI